MKLTPNDLGTLKTEDGLYAVRRINDFSWAIQQRCDPADPWSWQVIGHARTRAAAITALREFIETAAP